jgi:type I restriction enzyme S subunit
MNKWETVRLRDVCEVVSGTTPKSSVPEFWDGEANWVTPAELTDDSDIVYETQRKLTELGIRSKSLKPFPAGTVLLSSRAPIGKVAIAGTEMFCNQGFKNLICSDKIFNRYLYRYLRGKTEYLNSLGRGATFKEISKTIVEDIAIPLPPIGIQHKMADTLDQVCSIIVDRKRQLEQLDLMVKSQFVEMFGAGVDSSAVELKEICSIITDGTHQPPKFTNDGIPFLLVANIVDNEITYNTEKYITREDYEILIKRTPLEIGDLLLTTVGSYGNPAIVRTEREFCFQRHIAYMKPKKEAVNSVYLHAAFMSDAVREQIEVKVKGIAQKTLNLSELKTIKVKLPPLLLQTRFADFVRQADKSKFEIQQGLKQLELQYNALMQKYFG